MAEEARWYVVHTYSGYENTVKATIEKSVENRHLEHLIHQVLIPTETVTENVTVNKKDASNRILKDEFGENITEVVTKTVERKIYPGYVIVKMVMTDEAWYIINSVRGVTGFVGADADAKPMIRAIPLTDEEALQLGIEKRTVEVAFKVGDRVKILDGPLTGFVGEVDELDVDNNEVGVAVMMFGRKTSQMLELDQVEPVQE